jgi:hypothetical protein
MPQSAFEFEPAAADVAQVVSQQAQRGGFGDGMAGLVDFLFIDEHASGEDKGLRAFAAGKESALYKQFV